MAAFTNFSKWAGTPFGPHILPIIPRDAKLKEGSRIDPGQLGKVPGKWLKDEQVWTGFHAWVTYRTTNGDLARWDRWQAVDTGTVIGSALILGRNFIAFDIDCDDPELADQIEAFITLYLGHCPAVRLRGGSARRVLFYARDQHTAPITKRILRIRKLSDGSMHAVELLGAGQKVMIEGPHASGAMYAWRDGDLNAHTEWFAANQLNSTQTDQMMNSLGEWVEQTEGLEKVKLSLPSGGDVDAISVTDIMSPNRSLDLDVLARCVEAIDLNCDKLADYDSWVVLLRAICAACGKDPEFFANTVLPWLRTNATNVEDDGDARMEMKWQTFVDSTVGAEFVYQWAASFGCNDGIAMLDRERAEQAQELFNGTPDVTGAVGDAGQGAGGVDAAGLPGAGNPGGGPLPFPDTHNAIAAAAEIAFADTWRHDVDQRKWFCFEAGKRWEEDPRIASDLGVLMADMSRQVLATVNGPQGAARSRALESAGTLMSVKRLMEGRKVLTVRSDDWDTHHHLLNTPDGIVDLRSGHMASHDPSLLLRGMTAVGPELLDYGNWEKICPKWLGLIRQLAWGRPGYEAFLQRWFGYCLTGKITHQHFLYIQGAAGTGKSQALAALLYLIGTYALSLPTGFVLKTSGGEKRFDMAQIMGKRFGFGDEMQKGASWDESRTSKVSGADVLEVEFKGGASKSFTNTIKLNLTGNHHPHFVSPEAGGLMRRMLMLEMISPVIESTAGDIENYARKIIAEEGPGILSWCIEGARQDYADENGRRFNEIKAPLRAAAKDYAQESNPIRDWVEELMIITPEEDVDLSAAWTSYQAYMRNKRDNGAARETRIEFRTALKAAFPEIEYGKRTTGSHPNRAFFKGIGFNQADVAVPG